MWQALGKYVRRLNEWMSDWWDVGHPRSAPGRFSFQLFNFSSFSAGGWALPPGSHCQAGKRGLAAPNQCTDSHVIICFLTVPCGLILSDTQEEKELSSKKHQEVGTRGWQGKQEYPGKISTAKALQLWFPLKIKWFNLLDVSHFNNCLQPAPSSLAPGLGHPTDILPNSGLSKDSPDGQITARGNQCGPAHTIYIPSGYD